MFTKEASSLTQSRFLMAFGQYMAPELAASDGKHVDLLPQFEEIIGPDWLYARQFSSGDGQIVSRIHDRLEK